MIPSWIEQTLGAGIMLLVLLDVFVTVLYARAGTGILAPHMTRVVWRCFRVGIKSLQLGNTRLFAFCGPAIIVIVVLSWALLLTLGSALVIHPALGSQIQRTGGETTRDFISALYAGGSSLAVVGASDYEPQSAVFRAFYLLNSLIGMSVVTFTLAFIVQIYAALQSRNSFALGLHTLTGCTDDAAVLIAGLGPRGTFQAGLTTLSSITADSVRMNEYHHFYPVIFYFRFEQSYYSISRYIFTLLDTVSLIKSALDDDEFGWLKESAAAAQCWHASMLLVDLLEKTFLPADVQVPSDSDDDAVQNRWHARYRAAVERIRQSGIRTIADEEAGIRLYVRMRQTWDQPLMRLASAMLYDAHDIDPITRHPAQVEDRPPSTRGLHEIPRNQSTKRLQDDR